MITLHFSDTHIRDKGSFPPFNRIEENGFSRELNNCILGFQFVADKIKEIRPSAVFFHGDLYHTPEGLTTQVIHGSSLALQMVTDACEEVGCPFFIFPGNHDMVNDKIGITSVATLNGYADLVFDNRVVSVGKFKVGIVQFNTDKVNVAKNLERMEKKVDLIATHLDFKGARYETGRISSSVISPKLKVPVISGDIHLPQDLNSVHYIGSLIQNRFNREDLEGVGGVLTYDFKSKKVKRYPNTYSKHYVKVVDKSLLLSFDAEKVVMQIRCPLTDDERAEIDHAGYEYVYLPIPEKASQVAVGSVSISMETPEQVLRGFVNQNRPDAVSLFDEIVGGGVHNG
jgi:DNA repair exonuclease SbcCD nuclease subunit